MNIKKAVSLLLAGALVIALAACQEKDIDNGSDSSDIDGSDSAVAMGRYIEEVWQSPDYQHAIAIHRRPDDKIALIAYDDAQAGPYYYCIRQDDGSWLPESPAWFESFSAEAARIRSIAYNTKGEGVVMYYGKRLDDSGEETYRVALIGADGALTGTTIGEIDPWAAGSTPPQPAESDSTAAEDDSTTAVGDSAAAEGDGESDAQPEATGTMPLFFNKALIGEDGMVYIVTSSQTGCFDPATGALLQSYTPYSSVQAVSGDELIQFMTVSGGERAGQPLDTNTLFFSDLKSGEVTRKLSSENLRLASGNAMTTGITMAAGGDNALYLTDTTGLYRIAPGGESWERLIDGALSSFSLPSITASQLIPHGENEFLVVFTKDGQPQLINCIYSTDTPTLPNMELTVYSMQDNPTVSQAVGAFRQQYPNTMITIRTLNDAESGGSRDDALKALNTELLAGKGPDLFVMDALPLQSYMEKGILADLSEVVGPMLDAGELLPAPAKTYERDGAIFAVPTRITVPTLWGDEEALNATESLDTLVAYAEANPGKRIFGDMTPQHLLYRLMPGEWDKLLGDDGQVDIDAVETLLTSITRLAATAEDAHIYSYFRTEQAQADYGQGDWESLYAPLDEDFQALSNKRSVLMTAQLAGCKSIFLPNGTMYKHGGGLASDDFVYTGGDGWKSELPDDMVDKVFRSYPAGSYEPASIIAVNAASEQQEQARAFVAAMLSQQTQSTDFSDGFPINRAAINERAEHWEDWWFGHSYYDNEDEAESLELNVEYTYPSAAMLKQVSATLETLDHPIRQNYTLTMKYAMQNWLTAALEQVVSGQATAREAAEKIAADARTVLAE